ncbi:hypothetical protein MU466_13650, partial [Staphylococcus aureus]|uniref:hypothetical protein n=1 Tax=Staphylococcus aureus TaxID=1280 RepID=UPI001FD0BF2C
LDLKTCTVEGLCFSQISQRNDLQGPANASVTPLSGHHGAPAIDSNHDAKRVALDLLLICF